MTESQHYSSYFPLSLKEHDIRAGYRTKPFMIQRPAILLITSGTLKVVLDGSTHPLKMGSSVILRTNGTLQLINDTDHSVRLHYLHYHCVQLMIAKTSIMPSSEAHGRIHSLHNLHSQHQIQHSSGVTLHHLLTPLEQSFKEEGEKGKLRRQLHFLELLLHLQAQHQMQGLTAEDTLQQTIDYLEDNFAKPIALSELPILAGMTPSSYCRAFKKLTGMTPGHYLTRIRMLRAKELMGEGQVTLRDIAQCVGYQDELYFSRVFKKTEGLSPSAYMKRKDRKIAVVSSYLLQDHLLALGIQPIAAPAYPKYYHTSSGFPSYLHDRLQGTLPLPAERPLSSSTVMRLSPDTIIKTQSLHMPNDRQWKTNPHTIFIHPSARWEQYLRELAGLVHREQAAGRIIERVETLEEEAKVKLLPVTSRGSWVIIRLLPGDCRLYGCKEHALADLIYTGLGFQPDPRVKHGFYRSYAFEDIVQLDPEQILILWSEQDEVQQAYQDERWLKLQAVRNNRVFIPESREWDPWGPIGREYMIHELVAYFVGLPSVTR